MYILSVFRRFVVRYYRNNSDIKPIFHFWHYQTARSRQLTNQNANPHRPNIRSGPLVLVITIVSTSIQLLVLTRFTSVLTASANTAQISLQPDYSKVSGSVNNNLWRKDDPFDSGIEKKQSKNHEKVRKITKKQLEYLGQRVKLLQRLTNKICKEKIESFV